MFGQPPESRERRTILVSAAVLGLALLSTSVVRPVSRRWSDREAAIAVTRERVARLRGLADQETQLVAAADARQEAGVGVVRLLRGRTVALVASDLQSLLQDHARLSRVSVSRLEVSNGADSAASLEQRVSASVSAVTDIYGLADLLNRLHSSTVLLSLDEVHVAPNPVLRGNLLQVALTVRAPFVLEP